MVVAVAAVSVLAGIPASGAAPGDPPAPTCPTTSAPTVSGRVEDPRLDEISGVVAGPGGVLWVEEDSGNPAAISGLSRAGALLDTVDVAGATNVDWEDLARAGGRLWIGDIGDNALARTEIKVYAIDEPADPSAGSVEAEVISLRYPDGPHDAEAMVVDRAARRLYVIEKQTARPRSIVFAVELSQAVPGSTSTLRPVGEVSLANVTAADLGPTGLVVKNYLTALLFPAIGPDASVEQLLAGASCPMLLGPSEAIAFSPDGRRLFTIPEGVTPAIVSVTLGFPEPLAPPSPSRHAPLCSRG